MREDGKEDEVFCLIGPKRYDVPWKVLEGQGFIAAGALHRGARAARPARCARPTPAADARGKFRVASENPAKIAVVEQLDRSATRTGASWSSGSTSTSSTRSRATSSAPLITGKTPTVERERLYDALPRRRDARC